MTFILLRTFLLYPWCSKSYISWTKYDYLLSFVVLRAFDEINPFTLSCLVNFLLWNTNKVFWGWTIYPGFTVVAWCWHNGPNNAFVVLTFTYSGIKLFNQNRWESFYLKKKPLEQDTWVLSQSKRVFVTSCKVLFIQPMYHSSSVFPGGVNCAGDVISEVGTFFICHG